jgi:hypothetical protein
MARILLFAVREFGVRFVGRAEPSSLPHRDIQSVDAAVVVESGRLSRE